MRDEELAAIKARWNWILRDALPTSLHAKMDVRALLAEVERSREIVQAMAHHMPEYSDYTGYYGCQFCGAERREEPSSDRSDDGWQAWLTHAPDCPVTQARAILADDGGEAEVTP